MLVVALGPGTITCDHEGARTQAAALGCPVSVMALFLVWA